MKKPLPALALTGSPAEHQSLLDRARSTPFPREQS